MKKQLLLLLCLLSISLNYSQTFNDGILEYTVTSGTNVSVKKYNFVCPTGSLIIPNTIIDSGTTYTVTSIHSTAFSGCNSLTSVTIPNSVTLIDWNAFSYCSNLTNIIIPNSVTNIEFNAFRSCSGLTNVTIPNSVISIGNSAFWGCSSLTGISIPNSVTNIGQQIFYNCGSLINVTISNSVASIPELSFGDCTALTSVTIPNSVTNIGSLAFSSCINLTNISISNSVTNIGRYAFSGCNSLTSISIPNSVTSIDIKAFENCTALINVEVNWATPLVVPTDIFEGVNVSAIPLTVPSGTVALYQATTVWQDFGSFVLSTADFIENNISVQLFPNPVQDQLNITLSNNLSLKEIHIYNNLGQLIKKRNIGTIDVSDLQGVYFAKIMTDKGNITKKVIIE